MVADDDVDLESLQAQIDMSMSFAHNLVESWIKPIHRAQLGSSGADASQILEENQPPRLGVGASIPMAPLLAHEASKLKRRLGKHGAKNEGVVESQPQEADNEEHKGRPSKRKEKVDPFGHAGSKKKRRVEPRTNSCPSAEGVSEPSVFPLESSRRVESKNNNPSSRKEKQQTVRSPQTTFSADLTTPVAPYSEPSRETSAPVPEKTTLSSRVRANSITLDDTAKPLGIPLLNLDGPPELIDTPGNARELSNSRRKRKRRKKKKTKNINTQDNSH